MHRTQTCMQAQRRYTTGRSSFTISSPDSTLGIAINRVITAMERWSPTWIPIACITWDSTVPIPFQYQYHASDCRVQRCGIWTKNSEMAVLARMQPPMLGWVGFKQAKVTQDNRWSWRSLPSVQRSLWLSSSAQAAPVTPASLEAQDWGGWKRRCITPLQPLHCLWTEWQHYTTSSNWNDPF